MITHSTIALTGFITWTLLLLTLMELIRIVRDAKVGDVLAVISSDDGSKKDIPLWLAKAKHELLGTEPVEGATRFICRKTH